MVSPVSSRQLAFIKRANADVRALQTSRTPIGGLNSGSSARIAPKHAGVLVMGPMAEVQPEQISARTIEGTKLFRGTRLPDRRFSTILASPERRVVSLQVRRS
ncbi:hypothetical protein MA20_20190 [Bradyrhizobium japonicum]|uniref:Uncharacterized protein n=1 Tax=Bradyrhizobium japonicum TaxID=375 RepID=A0A0A3YWG9_BRAJP|nr:hypothetical protein MA20_20190 [Bradyrhizobium japonicum]